MESSYRPMSSKRIELEQEIVKWDSKISEDNEFLEIAFFKVFVKFEIFITDIIVEYATKSIENEDKVKLRIVFEDREHFKGITGLDYLDTSPKTKKLVEKIFAEDNQISFFFNSSDAQFFDEMKTLRNYIAHESEESKRKYLIKTLKNPDSGFMEPNDFLKSKRKRERDSVYTKFINLVQTYSKAIDYDS